MKNILASSIGGFLTLGGSKLSQYRPKTTAVSSHSGCVDGIVGRDKKDASFSFQYQRYHIKGFTLCEKGSNKVTNQDRTCWNLLSNNPLFSVVDGMGGQGRANAGEIAAQLFSESIIKQAPKRLILRILEAHEAMKDVNLGNGGCCFVTGELDIDDKNKLGVHITKAGDCKMLVFDKYGEIKYESNDPLKQFLLDYEKAPLNVRTELERKFNDRRHIVPGAITGSHTKGINGLSSEWVPLSDGDFLLGCTDGIMDSLTPVEIGDILFNRGNGHKTVEERLSILKEIVLLRHCVSDACDKSGSMINADLENAKAYGYTTGWFQYPKSDDLGMMGISIVLATPPPIWGPTIADLLLTLKDDN